MTGHLKIVALLLAVGPYARGAGIEVGVASVDMTPPLGYRMAGYFAERRNTGTKDPLTARAIVFRQGETRAALVFCDLVSVPEEIATRARQEAGRRTGIPPAQIAVAATHSHTGPLFSGVLRTLLHEKAVARQGKDEAEGVDYPSVVVDRVAGAVTEAAKALKPSEIAAGSVRETRLSFNRRFHMKDGSVRFNLGPLNPEIVRPAGPIDPEVGLLLVRPDGGGRPTAALTVFALHLDTVGGTEYSADYPYFLEKTLRAELGEGFVSLFGAGTCGDINHIDVSRRERARTEEIGRTLGRTVLNGLKSLKTVENPRLAVAVKVVEVPWQRVQPAEVSAARKVLADAFDIGKTPFLETVRASRIVDLADNTHGPNARLEVQAFRIGADLAIVTLPGEVFVEHGLAIKKASPFRTTLVIELANASPAYIPTRKAFAEGSYEVVNSRIAPGGGERLVEAAVRLLETLKAGER